MALEHRHGRHGFNQALLCGAVQRSKLDRVGGTSRRRQRRIELVVAKTPGVLTDELGCADRVAVIEDVKPVRGIGMPIATRNGLEVTGIAALGDLGQRQQFDGEFEADLFQIGLNCHRQAAGECTGLVHQQVRGQTLAIFDPVTTGIALAPAGLVEDAVDLRNVVVEQVLKGRVVVAGIGRQKVAFGLVFAKTGDPGQAVAVDGLGHWRGPARPGTGTSRR